MSLSKLQDVAHNMLQRGHALMTALNHQSIHHEQSLTLNTVALFFLFRDKKSSPPSLTMCAIPMYNTYPNYQIMS